MVWTEAWPLRSALAGECHRVVPIDSGAMAADRYRDWQNRIPDWKERYAGALKAAKHLR